MKMPFVTITLVSAALVYVLWSELGEQAEPMDSSRFSNLAVSPATRADVVNFIIRQIPAICKDAAGGRESAVLERCRQQADSRSSACRRLMIDHFPDAVSSDALFRDLSISMIGCLVPQSGMVEN